tara:strand:- start:17706 stop:18695 length:990 start_codon:yes stop_codon:yes gene_type:complete
MLDGSDTAVDPENSTHDETETLSYEEKVAMLLAKDENVEPQPEKEGSQEPQELETEEEEVPPDPESDSKESEDDLSFLDEEETAEEVEEKPALSKGVQKRIDKLTSQKYALEDENQKLKDQVKELESQPKANQNQDFGKFTSEVDVDKHESQLTAYVDFAEEALAEYDMDPDKVTENLDKVVPEWKSHTDDAERFLKNVLLNSNRALRQVPKQREFARYVASERRSAEKEFPWLKDPSNKRTQWVENQKRKFPQLASIPGVDKYLGFAIEGMAKGRGRAAASTPKTEPTPQPKTPNGAKPTGDRLKAASENVMRHRNRDALAGWLKEAL